MADTIIKRENSEDQKIICGVHLGNCWFLRIPQLPLNYLVFRNLFLLLKSVKMFPGNTEKLDFMGF